MKVIIVGGVAGGASAAARLRRLDESAEIILLERGEYISFANCGLPYYIGGEITDKRNLTLQTPASFHSRFNIDVRVNNEATEINPDTKTISILNNVSGEKYVETYDKLILSPGAEPIRPSVSGVDSKKVFTLRNIPDTFKIKEYIEKEKPKSAVVVGGGYIGVEMSENLASLGLDVAIIDLSDNLIAPLDFDMSIDVHRHMESKGIRLYLEESLLGIRENENDLILSLKDHEIKTDFAIMSIGVLPDTKFLKNSGIELNNRGSIKVNRHMQTNIKDIYAVGDAIEVQQFLTKKPSFIPLAGPANKQGRIASDNICGIKSEYHGTQGSAVLKCFDLTIATTGLSEKEAVKSNVSYDKTYIYAGSHASYYPGATNMSLKVIWDSNTLKLLGAQGVGFDGVDKRIDVLATAIRFGAKITDLTQLELCYAPPFGSAKDPVNMLGFVAENIISGKVKQFFWHDINDLPRDGSVTLLDVRARPEVLLGMIDGFLNIPLDELRENLGKVPKEKPVYVHCHSGLRSYIACRILSGLGYDCYNLAGGYRLYSTIVNEDRAPEHTCK